MSDDTGIPPTADEAAQQEADKIDDAFDGALEQIHDGIETLQEIAADFEKRHDELTADEPAPVAALLENVREVDAQVELLIADAPAAVVDEAVVGTIAPEPEEPVTREADEWVMPVLPSTDVPFPHDHAGSHQFDNAKPGTVFTKTSRGGFRSQIDGVIVDGNPIGKQDAFEHLPCGAIVEVGPQKQIVLILPSTEQRAPVATMADRFLPAVAQLWPWLVTEGTAVLPPAPVEAPPTFEPEPSDALKPVHDAAQSLLAHVLALVPDGPTRKRAMALIEDGVKLACTGPLP